MPALKIAALAFLAWLLVFAAPTYAQRLYTTRTLIMHELEWELEQVENVGRSTFLITSKGALPFLLKQIPTINMDVARYRAPQISWHMQQGTFRELLVSQVVRPTSAVGDLAVDPEDELPESFQLEPLAIKRFGARWIRISRINAIVTTNPTARESHLSGVR